jgi:peptide/nickel transport system ATP-binding protein
LQQRLDFACLFIGHDLAVVDQVRDRIAVMSRGRLIEQGDREQVLRNPQNAYTRQLAQAAPVPIRASSPAAGRTGWLLRLLDLKSC